MENQNRIVLIVFVFHIGWNFFPMKFFPFIWNSPITKIMLQSADHLFYQLLFKYGLNFAFENEIEIIVLIYVSSTAAQKKNEIWSKVSFMNLEFLQILSSSCSNSWIRLYKLLLKRYQCSSQCILHNFWPCAMLGVRRVEQKSSPQSSNDSTWSEQSAKDCVNIGMYRPRTIFVGFSIVVSRPLWNYFWCEKFFDKPLKIIFDELLLNKFDSIEWQRFRFDSKKSGKRHKQPNKKKFLACQKIASHL